MDIEQVKLIVDVIRELGVQGKEGLIWWLAINELLPTVAWSAFGFTFLTFLYRILHSFTYSHELLAMRKVLFPRAGGYLTDNEVRQIVQETIRLKGLDK